MVDALSSGGSECMLVGVQLPPLARLKPRTVGIPTVRGFLVFIPDPYVANGCRSHTYRAHMTHAYDQQAQNRSHDAYRTHLRAKQAPEQHHDAYRTHTYGEQAPSSRTEGTGRSGRGTEHPIARATIPNAHLSKHLSPSSVRIRPLCRHLSPSSVRVRRPIPSMGVGIPMLILCVFAWARTELED